MRCFSRRALMLGSSLALLFSLSPVALGDPPANKDNHANKEAHANKQAEQAAPERHRRQGAQGPQINRREIRHTLERYAHLQPRGDDLPPGIRKKLARGKPLPPGIAKRLDDRLYRELPHYPNYEWRQVGRDLVLITATGVLYEILENVLD
jgi:Ni/Co efflux regulator RcnB